MCKYKGPSCILSYTRLELVQGITGKHQRGGDIWVCPGALEGDVGKPSHRTKLHASVMIRKALKSSPEALRLVMEKWSKL